MVNLSPEKSPDVLQRPQFTKLRSPERSPILTRRSRSHERSPNSRLMAKELRSLKHRSLEIPHASSPDNKRRANIYEGSSESPDRPISTPIPIPVKPPPSHSASSSEITPDKTPPQGDDTSIQVHTKTESDDSTGAIETVTPKLEEAVFPESVRLDRSTSAAGEVEPLPPLPEETSLSPDISRSLKVANANVPPRTPEDGSEVSRSLDEELFKMLDSKEGSVEPSLEDNSQEEKVESGVERKEKPEGVEDTAEHVGILAEFDEMLAAAEEEDEYDDEEEDEEKEEVKVDKPDDEESKAKEMVQTSTKPTDEQPDLSLASESTEVESEHEFGVSTEGTPLEAEQPADVESKPPKVEPKPPEVEEEPIEDKVDSSSSSKAEPESPPQIKPEPEDIEHDHARGEEKPHDKVEAEQEVKVEVEHPQVTVSPPVNEPKNEPAEEFEPTKVVSEPPEVHQEPSNVNRESQTVELDLEPTVAESKHSQTEPELTQPVSEPPSVHPEPGLPVVVETPPSEDKQESPETKPEPPPPSLVLEEPCEQPAGGDVVEQTSSVLELKVTSADKEPEATKETSPGPPQPSGESQELEPTIGSREEPSSEEPGGKVESSEDGKLQSNEPSEQTSQEDEKKADDEPSMKGDLTTQDSLER